MLFDFMAIVNLNASSKYDTNIYLLPHPKIVYTKSWNKCGILFQWLWQI